MFEDLDGSKVDDVVKMLNMLYASEVIAAEQYWLHANDITGMYSVSIQEMFRIHADEEMAHAEKLRNQIHNLGGVLVNDLTSMVKNNPVENDSEKDVRAGKDAETMLKLDLVAELTAIGNYKSGCQMVFGKDPGTYILLAQILNDEYEHAQELKNLLG